MPIPAHIYGTADQMLVAHRFSSKEDGGALRYLVATHACVHVSDAKKLPHRSVDAG